MLTLSFSFVMSASFASHAHAVRGIPLIRPALNPAFLKTEMLDQTSAEVGLTVYAVGMGSLFLWETFAVPGLKVRGIIPDEPLVPGALTEREKRAPWIKPLTYNSAAPVPSEDDLASKEHHYVGTQEWVPQYITFRDTARIQAGVCEKSDEWSDLYGKDVYIFKRKV